MIECIKHLSINAQLDSFFDFGGFRDVHVEIREVRPPHRVAA